MIYSLFLFMRHCFFYGRCFQVNYISLFAFFKASLHDPVSLVPLALVPVDPCDIHLELHDDQVSTESSSSLNSSQDETSSALENACDSLRHDSSSGAVYWDTGGTEVERGLDSGISIPQVSHSSEEKGAMNGD